LLSCQRLSLSALSNGAIHLGRGLAIAVQHEVNLVPEGFVEHVALHEKSR
jgi:hypothetical protein